MQIAVSILIPAEEFDQYLLSDIDGRGWWLPYALVNPSESIKHAAERIATEIAGTKVNVNGVAIKTQYFRQCVSNQRTHITFEAAAIRSFTVEESDKVKWVSLEVMKSMLLKNEMMGKEP